MSKSTNQPSSGGETRRYRIVDSIGELLAYHNSRMLIETKYGLIVLTHKVNSRGKSNITASLLAYQRKSLFIQSRWVGHIFHIESIDPAILEDLLKAVIEIRKSML